MDLLLIAFISLLFLLLSKYVKINDKKLTVLYIILVSLLAANRNVLIQDTLAYIHFYNNLSFDIFYEVEKSYMEVGFIILSVIVKMIIGSNYKLYFFIIVLANMLMINKSICNIFDYIRKNSKYNPKYFRQIYPLSIYMLTYGFTYNYITLRAGLGFSMALLAFSYLPKSRFKAALFYLSSIMFPNSALVLIMILPFIANKVKLSKKFISTWLIMLLPALFVGYQNYLINTFFYITSKFTFLALRFHPYLNQDVIVDQKGAILRAIIMIFLGFILSKKFNVNKVFNILLISYLVGLTGFVLFINISIIGRIVEMFTSSLFLLIALNRIFSKKRIMDFMLISMGLVYFLISNYRLIT